jgi:GTPase SAR1 family protein
MESSVSDKLFDDILTPEQVKNKQKAIDNKVCDAFLSRVPSKCINVVTRNIVMIGRTRSGKSTFKKFLVNPTIVAENMTIFSDTKVPEINSFLLYQPELFQHNASNVLREDGEHERSVSPIVLNIMDTPGLFESRDDGDQSRTNKEILKLIEDCMKREICQYHAIFFCASLDTGSNKEDLDSFMIIRNFLGKDVTKHACLIITRCESKTEQQRTALLEEMRRQTQYREMIDFFKGGVFFSGALNFDDYNTGDEGKITRQFQAIDF